MYVFYPLSRLSLSLSTFSLIFPLFIMSGNVQVQVCTCKSRENNSMWKDHFKPLQLSRPYNSTWDKSQNQEIWHIVQYQCYLFSMSVRETRSWGGLLLKSASWGGLSASWGLFFLCIMITEKRTKIVLSHNDVYEPSYILCLLSMHQFIEISIGAFEEEKKFKHKRTDLYKFL